MGQFLDDLHSIGRYAPRAGYNTIRYFGTIGQQKHKLPEHKTEHKTGKPKRRKNRPKYSSRKELERFGGQFWGGGI